MPVTVTASPTATDGVTEPVNTKRPSLVRGSLSGWGSCIQKPREEPNALVAVTMPGTRTTLPTSGDVRVVPWTSRMRASIAPLGPPGFSPAEFSGVGGPTTKSVALLSVSADVVRKTDVVALGAGAGLVSRTTALP